MDREYEKDVSFITSAGRTGTTFLGGKLSDIIEDCYSCHEPDDLTFSVSENISRVRKFGFFYMIAGRLIGKTGLRPIGTRFLRKELSVSHCCQLIYDMRNSYFNSIRSSLVIESNPQWHYLVNLIPLVWPKAKIAVIIRDPRTWVRSWINKGLRHTITDMVKYFPPGRLSPKSTNDDLWVNDWGQFDTFERLCWEWQSIYRRLSSHSEFNELCRIFSYEQLFGSGSAGEWSRLLEHLTRHGDKVYRYRIPEDFTGKRVHASEGRFPGWQEWSPGRARKLDRLCGDLMRRYGYGEEPLWQEKLALTG